jgi:hypothetical protein
MDVNSFDTAKALEEFMQDLVTAAASQAQARKQNKVTSAHLCVYCFRIAFAERLRLNSKAAVLANPTFDFLKDHVANIGDLAAYDPDAEDVEGPPKKVRKPRKDKGVPKGKRAKKAAVEDLPAVDLQDLEMPSATSEAPAGTSKLDDDEDYDN